MANNNKLSVNVDIAQRLDITCRKGDSFELILSATDASGVDVDFTTYTDFLVQVRPTDEDTGTPVLSFTFSDFTAEVGTLSMTKDAASMSSVTAGTYVYDMQMTDASAKVVTWFYGVFTINDDVSF